MPDPEDKSIVYITIFGMTLPLRRWAIAALSVVVVIGVSVAIYYKVVPQTDLLTFKEMNERLASEVEEYGLHAMEEPAKHELLEDTDGALAIRVFADHCVLIQRKTRTGLRTKLVPDLAKERLRTVLRIQPPEINFLPVVHAAPQSACNRGCLNPHPGQFRWWYGQRRGDWVEVWRQWPDGCQHYQLFHPPSGTWDSMQNGTAKVNWTCCVH